MKPPSLVDPGRAASIKLVLPRREEARKLCALIGARPLARQFVLVRGQSERPGRVGALAGVGCGLAAVGGVALGRCVVGVDVVAGAAAEAVGPRAAGEPVVAAPAAEDVVTAEAVEAVVAVLPEQQVGAPPVPVSVSLPLPPASTVIGTAVPARFAVMATVRDAPLPPRRIPPATTA